MRLMNFGDGTIYSAEEIARTRNAIFILFAANGFAFASWMSRLPDIKDTLHLTPGEQGVMLLAISAGSLIGLPLAGRIVSAIGARRAIRAAAFVVIPGFILALAAVALGDSHYLVMPGLLLFGLGTGLWDVAQNLVGAVVEQASRKSIMSWFHAAFSGGTVAGALVGAGVVALGVPMYLHLGAMALLLGGVAVVCPAMISLRLDGRGVSDESNGEDVRPVTSARSAWTEPRTLLIGVMVLAGSFAEGTANDWMAIAFVDGHGVTNAMGVVALAVFLAFMTAGRIFGTQMLDQIGRAHV